MKRQRKIVFWSLFILLIGAFILFFQYSFVGCFWWNCVPTRSFSILDLDLPDNLLPVESDINHLSYDRDDITTIADASTTNYWDGGQAIYIVQQYVSINKASKYFSLDSKYSFAKPIEKSNTLSEILQKQSEFADESVIICGYTYYDELRCVYIARYQEYKIFFSSTMDDDHFTEENFLKVINFLDNRFFDLFQSE